MNRGLEKRHPMTSPNEMRDILAGHVDRGEMPGLVSLVSRRGEVHVEVIGTKAAGSSDPMRRDTLFRIASMSKPVTAAAAMILVDEGKLQLDESVERLLPELANRRVLKRIDGPVDDTVPADRAITVRDLLTMRMGFGILFGHPSPIVIAAERLKLGAFGPPKPLEAPAPDEWIRRFATLPLMHQPGAKWMYHTGIEVLSVLVARAAGKPLDAFLHERIFEPLGMTDTFFSVPESKLDRLATSYVARDPFHPDVGGFDLYDPVQGGQWSRAPAFPSGGAGLVSTADDFLAFGRLMLGRGAVGATRILSAASVDAMTTDQLTAGQKALSPFVPPDYWDSHGWGLGLAIVTAPDDLTGTYGRYGWDGGLGTSWCTDPARDLVGILMTQRSAFPPMAGVYRDFWKTVYRG
jgi:CubicO group peptidase (beta-lactamase class C family)